MSLPVVGSCCAKFETAQTFINVQTDSTTLNHVGSCWSKKSYSCGKEMNKSKKRAASTAYGFCDALVAVDVVGSTFVEAFI